MWILTGCWLLRCPQVSQELRASIQRSYVETLQRLDGALTAICGEFSPVRYSKVHLMGYSMGWCFKGQRPVPGAHNIPTRGALAGV